MAAPSPGVGTVTSLDSSRVELDAGTVDEGRPLFSLSIHELQEHAGVGADRLDAGCPYARLQLRALSDLDQRIAELPANIGWKSGRTEQAHPARQHEIGKPGLGHGRHVRQFLQTL